MRCAVKLVLPARVNLLGLFFFWFLAAIPVEAVMAQSPVKGRVVDEQTNAGVPFARLRWGINQGAIADADGFFELQVPAFPFTVNVEMLGYQPTPYTFNGEANPMIRLKPGGLSIAEVEIRPGENPAHRIIETASMRRKANDPEQNTAFQYNSYQKLYIGLRGPDSTGAVVDQLDSMYAFLTETRSKRIFKDAKNQQEIIEGARVSGMREASFGVLASQLQPVNFYRDLLLFGAVNYVSPLVENATRLYRYEWVDTLLDGVDTVFVIEFEPRKGKTFDALKGVLYIHSQGYALQQVIAEPNTAEDQRITSKYEMQSKRVGSYWFPEQQVTFIKFRNQGKKGDTFEGVAKAYNTEIELLSADSLQIKPKYATEFKTGAGAKDETFWASARVGQLEQREAKTYQVIDSVVRESNAEWTLKLSEYLVKNEIPIGKISLVPTGFLRFNRVEGTRLGLAVKTNDRLFKHAAVSAYGGYGFVDKRWKWGSGLDLYLIKDGELTLKYNYLFDLEEPGGLTLTKNRSGVRSTEYIRNFYLTRMDEISRHSISLPWRVHRTTTVTPFAIQEQRRFGNYGYQLSSQAGEAVSLRTLQMEYRAYGLAIRWAPGQRLDKLMGTVMPIASRHPVVQVWAQQGVLTNASKPFNRVHLQIDHTVPTRLSGEINYRLTAGYADITTPYPLLARDFGNRNGQWSLPSFGSLETAGFYELLYNRFALVNVYWDLKRLLVRGKKFSPGLLLIGNGIIGDLQGSPMAEGLSYRVPNKGFAEGGLVITNLLKLNFTAFGVGVFAPLTTPQGYKDPIFKLFATMRLD